MAEVKRINRFAPYGPREHVIIKDPLEEDVIDSDGQVEEDSRAILIEFGFDKDGAKIPIESILKKEAERLQ
jgi:hypothetical protein